MASTRYLLVLLAASLLLLVPTTDAYVHKFRIKFRRFIEHGHDVKGEDTVYHYCGGNIAPEVVTTIKAKGKCISWDDRRDFSKYLVEYYPQRRTNNRKPEKWGLCTLRLFGDDECGDLVEVHEKINYDTGKCFDVKAMSGNNSTAKSVTLNCNE